MIVVGAASASSSLIGRRVSWHRIHATNAGLHHNLSNISAPRVPGLILSVPSHLRLRPVDEMEHRMG